MKFTFNTKSQFYIKHGHKGFALIYTLLFITLLLVTVSVTWVTGMADLRLAQRSNYSIQAYELAQSAIEAGFVQYKSSTMLGSSYPFPSDTTLTFPSGSCTLNASNGYPVHRMTIVDSSGNTTTSDALFTKSSVNLAPYGVYDYRICTSSGSTIIFGIGYYKGSKVSLQAIVSHSDVPIMGPNPAPPPTQIQTGWNHDADYITINQSGPSQ